MRIRQAGFSLIELLIVVAIILIIAAIAIPNLLRSHMAANETSAVASLRAINTSQVVYQSSFGPGFATTLSALSDGGAAANCVPPTAPVSTSACLLDSVLAAGTKSGYNFAYAPVGVAGVIGTYTINGDPISPGSSGQRHFFTDQTLVIRVNDNAAAAAGDPAI
jgi:prepilin-type N-terminal cleavage/methylation domain-containing protein